MEEGWSEEQARGTWKGWHVVEVAVCEAWHSAGKGGRYGWAVGSRVTQLKSS